MSVLIAPSPLPVWRVLPVPIDDQASATRDRVGPAADQQLVGVPLTSVGFLKPETQGPASATARIVRGLRDEIRRATGLTRQDMAAIIGVDRRSLTGWANGSIDPLDENLNRLRRLARLVSALDQDGRGSARWVFDAREPLEEIDVVRAIREDDLGSVVRALRRHVAHDRADAPSVTTVSQSPQNAITDTDWDEFGGPDVPPLIVPSVKVGSEANREARPTPGSNASRWARHRADLGTPKGNPDEPVG